MAAYAATAKATVDTGRARRSNPALRGVLMAVLSVAASKHDHVQGSLDAPVVLVEYADYQCPQCGEAFSLVQRLQQRFGDALCVVYRNFPLVQSHPQALPAAIV